MPRGIWIFAILMAAGTAGLAQSDGEATYKAQCQMCHGATGQGDTPAGKALQAKSLTDPEVVKETDAAIIEHIKSGSTKMPAFKEKLTDAQLEELVAYIRTLEKK